MKLGLWHRSSIPKDQGLCLRDLAPWGEVYGWGLTSSGSKADSTEAWLCLQESWCLLKITLATSSKVKQTFRPDHQGAVWTPQLGQQRQVELPLWGSDPLCVGASWVTELGKVATYRGRPGWAARPTEAWLTTSKLTEKCIWESIKIMCEFRTNSANSFGQKNLKTKISKQLIHINILFKSCQFRLTV